MAVAIIIKHDQLIYSLDNKICAFTSIPAAINYLMEGEQILLLPLREVIIDNRFQFIDQRHERN